MQKGKSMTNSRFLCLGLAAAACGNLVDERHETTPLATVTATLRLSDETQAAPWEDLKVALIWESPKQHALRLNSEVVPTEAPCTEQPVMGEYNCSAEPYETIRSCTYERESSEVLTNMSDIALEFPLDFSMALRSPPPVEALYSLADQGGTGSFAMANIIVFDDRDQDAEFDWGRIGVEPERIIALSEYIDQVAASAPGESAKYFRIAYLDGTIDLSNVLNESIRSAAQATPQGFSIWENTLDTSDPATIPIIQRTVLNIDRKMELFAFVEVERTFNGCQTWRETVVFTRDEVEHPEGVRTFQCGSDTEITLWPQAELHEKWVAPCDYDWGRVQRFCISDLAAPPADWPCDL